MQINDIVKKSVIPLLILATIVLSVLPLSNRAQAMNEVNLALNPNPDTLPFPKLSASFTCGCDNVWSTVNGVISYTNDPRDRWTNYGSNNQTDWVAVDWDSSKMFNQVKLYLYDDGGGVQPPAGYRIQYWNGSSWVDVPNPTQIPETPQALLNIVNFDAITASQLRVVLINQGGSFSGIVELEIYLHLTEAETNAVNAIMAQIEQLPNQAAVLLSDKSAIAAARAAYEQLAATPKGLVTNISRLIAAEEAIAILEAPGHKDIKVLSAFSDAAGTVITLKLSSVLDTMYGIQADKFIIMNQAMPVSVMNAVYDATDSSHQTIKLIFSTPVLLDVTGITMSMQGGAFKTSQNEFNTAAEARPVITFKDLDLSLDQRIGIDDIVQIIVDPALQMDVNQDGVFNQEDISTLLGQISPIQG